MNTTPAPSDEEIDRLAARMGLERALRLYPDTVRRSAARVIGGVAALPEGWSALTLPAGVLAPARNTTESQS